MPEADSTKKTKRAVPETRPPITSAVLVLVSGAVVLFALGRRGLLTAEALFPRDEPVASALPLPSAADAPPTDQAPKPAIDEDEPVERRTCAIEDPGMGPYADWQPSPVGRLLVPKSPPSDRYDLLIHMHGGEGARRSITKAGLSLPLVAIDEGVGSQAYAQALYGPEPLEDLLTETARVMEPARLRFLVVSAWSAGYGGVREILREHPTTLNAVVLLDSVHAGYESDSETMVEMGLETFVSLAQRATQRETIMVFTHSEIEPPTFASTTRVADHLLGKLDLRRGYAGLLPSHGVELKTEATQAGFHLRGYTGTDKPAHCAHLRMLGDIVKDEVLPALEAAAAPDP